MGAGARRFRLRPWAKERWRMARWSRALMACLISVPGAMAAATDFPEQEPNDTFPPSASLGLFQSGDRIVGAVDPELDVDYHYIDTLGTGQFGLYRYVFTTEGIPEGGDSLLTIFDTNIPCFTLAVSDDVEPGSALWSRAAYDLWTDGYETRWGVLIEGYNTSDMWPYAISVTWSPIELIEAGEFAAGEVVFDTSSSTGIQDTEIALFAADGTFLATNDDISGSNHLSRLPVDLAPGEYCLSVSAWNTRTPEPGQDRSGIGPGEADEGDYTLLINGIPFEGTIQRGFADWYRLTVVAKAVYGHVSVDSFKGDLSQVEITFELREPGTQHVLQTEYLMLGSDGSYRFETSETGLVDVAAKGAVWLRSVQTVDLDGPPDPVDFSLVGGDANGDNEVNLVDVNLVLLNFGKTGSGLIGDVNGNAQVEIADLNLVLFRFSTVGAN
jgi:hypothetical protein